MYYECLKCLLWENCQELSLNTKCNVTKMICQDHLKPLPFPESSLAINQSSSECGLFAISSFLHPNCAQILKSRLYFQNQTSLFFFLIWFFAGLTLSVHSSVSEIYFWLLGQANMLIIFLSPKRLWNTIALIIYIPITLQWEIHYFKLNHLFLVYFAIVFL